MTTSIEYAQMASNAYAVKPTVHSGVNAIPIPDGWKKLGEDGVNNSTGFTARAYQNTTTKEIVIAYTGTTFEGSTLDKAKDWLFANIPAGTGVILAPQVVDAAKFYLDVLQANPSMSNAISFTGHSLGGGLASLMAAYLNRSSSLIQCSVVHRKRLMSNRGQL